MNPNSLVDVLKSQGQKSDFASRAQLASSKGISGYTGSAEQNIQLLNMLKGGTPTGQPSPQQPVQQPQAQPTAQPNVQPTVQPTGQPQVNSEQALIDAMVAKGHTPETARGAIAGRGYSDLAREYLGSGTGSTTGSVMPIMPTINLPEIYQNLYNQSGVTKVEEELSANTRSFNDAVSKINNNPFLSEATRVGRLQKLQTDFNNNTAGLRNDIATKKADIEMKLNLQTKQFDIQSDQAQLAFQQFQSLLSSGALANASGEDIAGITRSTGISSTLIQSAIKENNKKNVQTSIIQFDDGTNQGFAVVDQNTGEIIKKETITQSKPKATSVSEQKDADANANMQSAIGDIQRGATLRDVINHYAISGSGLTVEEIYRIYNSYSPYGTAKENIEDVKMGKFKV